MTPQGSTSTRHHDRARGGRRKIRTAGISAALLLGGLVGVSALGTTGIASAAAGTVTGRAFADHNDNGVFDNDPNAPKAVDSGIAGVTVTAFDSTGATVGTATTAADGTYNMAVTGAATTALRVEFSTPAGFLPGFHGAGAGTTAQFVNVGASAVDVGFVKPSEYCQDNPTIATSCFESGRATPNTTTKTLVEFPYASGAIGTPGSPIVPAQTTPAPTVRATLNQTGSTYGLAYQQTTNNLFLSAFQMTNTDFGAGGNDAIYRYDRTTGTLTQWFHLNAAFGAGAAGPNPRLTPGHDVTLETPTTFDLAGKTAFGDIDMGPDGTTVFAVDLNGKALIAIPTTGNPPVAGTAVKTVVPAPAGCAASDVQPFGLGKDATRMYVGVICSAESTQSAAGLKGYVLPFDPATHTFGTAVLTIPLNGPRGCALSYGPPSSACPAGHEADWRPWVSKATVANPVPGFAYAQPELTNIEFDNGNMIVSFRDRYPDQIGEYGVSPFSPADTSLVFPMGNGDVLRACGNATTGWTLESAASCGGHTTGGTVVPPSGRAQGPGGGEYYFQDGAQPAANEVHDEAATGGSLQVPGFTHVIVNTVDAVEVDGINTNGVRWFDNTTGVNDRAFQISDAKIPNSTFAKANGLGDLDVICLMAPIQLGNRVWLDANHNGIQDAGEAPIAGVTVHLYQGATLVGTTLTAADGTYYFDASNVAGGVLPATAYTIKTDLAADSTGTGPLAGLQLTIDHAGTDVLANSKATVQGGVPTIAVTTGSAGASDHTLDIGFTTPAPLPAAIGDFVWLDTNHNGVQDVGEVGIAGVTVTLKNGTGTALATTTTNASGIYGFTNLAPGTYQVCFTAPTGYTVSPKNQGGNPATDSDMDATTGCAVTTTLVAGQTDLTWDAGLYLTPPPPELATIGDRAWFDTNGNGVQDTGENGVPNLTVTLKDGNGTVVGTTTTDSNGNYLFTNLTPGAYQVCFATPPGAVVTGLNQGGNPATDSDMNPATGCTVVTQLTAGEVDLTWDAGFVPPVVLATASIGDRVWIDANANGVQDAGEVGVAGVTVKLLDGSGNLVATTTTGSTGLYLFIGLTPGDYEVQFVVPSNFTLTLQNVGDDALDSDADRTTGRTAVTTLSPGEVDLTWDAGIIPTQVSDTNLPATGINAQLLLVLAGFTLLLGAGLVLVGARRRRPLTVPVRRR